jgi:hypothetical protein
MFMTLLALSSAHAVTFDAPGACGESVEIAVADLAPRGNFTFLLGYGAGDDVIPAGACAGADSGLNIYTFTNPFRADASGAFGMTWDMPERFCDTAVAVLDLDTCAISSMVVLGADDDDGGGDLGGGLVATTGNGDGTFTSAVDSSSYDDWVYVDMSSGAEVFPADPSSSLEWDLAFKRFEVAINGGVSGGGDASSMWLSYSDWGYAVPYLGAVPPFGWITDAADSDGDLVPEYSMGAWYDYDFMTHVLTPKEGIYLLSGPSGVYGIEFLSYYADDGTSGNPSFVWNVVD